MYQKAFSSFMLVFSLLFISCVQNLGGFIGTESFYLVEGVITDEFGPHTISVSRSVEFNTIPDLREMEGAEVKIIDDVGGVVLLEEVSWGEFETPEDFKGVVGRSYGIDITLSSGLRMTSSLEKLQEAPLVDDFSYQLKYREQVGYGGRIYEEKYVDFAISFCDPEEEMNFYRWEFKNTYEYQAFLAPLTFDMKLRRENGTQTKYCWRNVLERNHLEIGTDLLYNGDCRENVSLLGKELDRSFQIGLYIEVLQYSLTNLEYNYLSELQKQYDNKGTIFDTSNYQIRGNLQIENDEEELVLGFFSVRGIKRKSLFIYPQDVSYEHNYSACTFGSFSPPPNSCYDCRSSIAGKENIKPDFWPN